MAVDILRSIIYEQTDLDDSTKDSLCKELFPIYHPPNATDMRDPEPTQEGGLGPLLTPERAFEIGENYLTSGNESNAVEYFNKGVKLALKRTADEYPNLKKAETEFKTESEKYNSKISEIESKIEEIKNEKGTESEEYTKAKTELEEAKKSSEYLIAKENLDKAKEEFRKAKEFLISGMNRYSELSGKEVGIVHQYLDRIIGLVAESYKERDISNIFSTSRK